MAGQIDLDRLRIVAGWPGDCEVVQRAWLKQVAVEIAQGRAAIAELKQMKDVARVIDTIGGAPGGAG